MPRTRPPYPHRPLDPRHADALFLGPPGTGKSHLAHALGFAAIQQGHPVRYREAHVLLEGLAEAQLAVRASPTPPRSPASRCS